MNMYLFATLLISIFYLLYLVLQTVYDVYFGPLSKIPGPKLAAATRLVIFYHRFQGDAEFWISSLHREYGDIVRPAPEEISYASGKMWKEIYGHTLGSNSRVARTRKDPRFYDLKPLDINLVTAEDADHTRQRKLFSYAFSDRALMAQMPMLLNYVEQFMDILRTAAQPATSKSKAIEKDASDRDIDIAQAFNFMTFDIMADLMFGEPLGCLRDGAYTSWMKLTFSSFKIFTMTNELNHFPSLRQFLEALAPQNIKREYEKHLAHAFAQVDRRLARTDEDARTRPDIWTFVLNAKEEQKMRVSEMHSNANIFMLAGTETTATALSGLIYYLLQHPDKMERVTDEVRRAFASLEHKRRSQPGDDLGPSGRSGDGRTTPLEAAEVSTILQLPYMNACIEEIFRIYPPAPLGLPRVVRKRGMVLEGTYIPENTKVYVHMYSTTHNARNFAQPDTFVPERWLKDRPVEFALDDRAAMQPFLYGPRVCVGINLAYAEIRLGLAHVLNEFNLELCDESQNWVDQKVYQLWEKKPLMVRLSAVRT